MDSKERLTQLCETAMAQWVGYSEECEKRLRQELKAVDDASDQDYFLDLHDRGVKIDKNENNLLIAKLLGIVQDFDGEKPPVYVYGDWPDVDVDYVKDVRNYLKDEWAPKTFGAENVCNIGSYNTFGIKSSLIDMAKVFGADRDEVLRVTTKLGTKDDDGKVLTWEAAMQLNKDLAEYCKKYPDIASAAKRMFNRIRSRGKHAGGLIVSRIPIADLVPLCTDSDGNPVSAWTEGLHAQDLQPVGLVKYDVLGLTNLGQLAYCVKMIKERHGIDVMALPGQSNWSDTSYLNDKKSLELANQGKLRCVFQFDSAGMRELIKKGGVTSFDDLVAYTSVFRPGPLECLAAGTIVSTTGGGVPIESLLSWEHHIAYIKKDGSVAYSKRFLLKKTGKKRMLKITTKSGKTIICSEDHELLSKGLQFVSAKFLKTGVKIGSYADT